jgi:PAS domain S-box-containing protein
MHGQDGPAFSNRQSAVLVVDDDAEQAATVADILASELDVDTVTETDPTVVMDSLDGAQIDCIVSDYNMPDLDGMELLKRVREDRPDLPFVLLTGAGSESVASDAISHGVSEYVTKGTSRSYDELVKRVETHIDRYRTERRLRRVTERQRRWMDVATDGFFEYDFETDTLHLRGGFAETFGFERSRIENGSEWFLDRIHPDERDQVIEEFRNADTSGDNVVVQEFRFRSAEGQYRHVRHRTHLTSEDGTDTSLLGTLWDITDQIEQQEQLRQYELLLNSSEDGALLVGQDSTVKQVNDRICTLTGKKREDLTGEPASAVFDEVVDRKSAQELEETIASIIDGARHQADVELTLSGQTGSEQVVETSLTAMTSEGEVQGVALIARDITDRVRKQRALERVNEATNALVRASSREEIASITIDTIEEGFNVRLSSVWLVDEGESLRMIDGTQPARDMLEASEGEPFVHQPEDPVWQAFESGTVTVLNDLDPENVATDQPIESILVAPLNDYGIIAIADEADRPFSDQILDLTRILARTVTTALDRLEHERAIERNRELLAQSQRLANVGAWEYDVEEEALEWTNQVRRIHGTELDYTPTVEEGIQYYHSEDRSRVRQAFDLALEHGIDFDQRVRIIREDGQVRWVRNVGKTVTDNGDVVRIRGALQDITREYERERQVKRNEKLLRDLHTIIADSSRSTEERIEELLSLGRQRVGLAAGFLTSLDEETESVEVTQFVGDLAGVHEGQTLPLSDTYCRKVLENESVTTIHDVHERGLADDPAYQRMGMSAYLGAPLFVEGKVVGTLCYGDKNPRERRFSDLERAFVNILAQQASHLLSLQQRRQRLKTLHRATRSLLEADTPEEIPDRTVDAVDAIPDSPPIVFFRWDESDGRLQRAAVSESPDIGTSGLPDAIQQANNPIWESFVTSETQSLEPGWTAGTDWEGTDDRGILVPIGEFGILVAFRSAGFESLSFEIEFLETLARNVTATLETVEQNRTLQEYTTRLERQNERLERLGRINDIVRNTHRTLVEVSTREEIEQAVCANLAEVEHWDLAWIGTPSVGADGFDVRAGSDERAHAIALDGSETEGDPLAATTIGGDEPTEIPRILSAEGPEPWRQTALEFGFQSAVSIPIAHGDREYGVLEIYADRPGVFTDDEVEVLVELGTTIAYAIGSAEQRRALRSGSGVELDLTIPQHDEFLLSLGAELDQNITITSCFTRTDGSYLAYATTEDSDTVADQLRQIPVVDRATVFGADEGHGIEIRFQGGQLLRTLEPFDVQIQELRVADGDNRLRVVLPRAADVRDFFDLLQASYPEATLTAQRTRETEDSGPVHDPLAVLTDRQREILTIAYHRGLFAWPRRSSGEDVADALGIAPATFYQHLRAAQRQVFTALLGE